MSNYGKTKKRHTAVVHLTASLMFLLNFETPITEFLVQNFRDGHNKVSCQNTHKQTMNENKFLPQINCWWFSEGTE